MATRDTLFDIAYEFYTVDATELARIDRFIGYAEIQVDSDAWGARWELGVAYLTAHMLKLAELGAAGATVGAGPISAERVGDLSRSYQYGGQKDYELRSTTYGLEFLRLRRMTLRTPLLVEGSFTTYTTD